MIRVLNLIYIIPKVMMKSARSKEKESFEHG